MRAAIVIAVLLTVVPAHAQKVCDPQDPALCSQGLRLGDVAPFAGQLLTDALAIRLGQKADQATKRLDLEVEFVKKQAAVDLGLERQLRAIDKEAHDREVALLKEQAKVPFYQRPGFVAPVVAIVAIGTTILAVWAAGQLR